MKHHHHPATDPTAAEHYLPAMGRDWMLPLYDPFTRLIGARAAHRMLIEQAGLRSGQRILEIGTGTGNLLLMAKRRHPDVTATGLDPDPRALAWAGRKARRARVAVQFDRGFAADLPYPDGGFDRVFSAFMFHHLPAADRAAALREVRRVLAPGGSLHLVDFVPAAPSDGRFVRRAHRKVAAHGAIDDLPAQLRAAGFTDPAETGTNTTLMGRYATYQAAR